MGFSKKTSILAVCLFLIAFKAAAGSVFIQSAIERAHLQGTSCTSIGVAQNLGSQDASDEKQPVHAMYLMYHVTASISNTAVFIPEPSEAKTSYALVNDRLLANAALDPAFKPPKTNI